MDEMQDVQLDEQLEDQSGEEQDPDNDWKRHQRIFLRRDEHDRWDDVMAQLGQRVPENEGRWAPSDAARAYGETEQFEAETGLDDAASWMDAAEEPFRSGGAYTAGEVEERLRATAAYASSLADADATRNRYQQSTEFTPVHDPDEQKAQIAGYLQSDLDTLERNPAAMDVGMQEEVRAYHDWMQYQAWTGKNEEYQGTGLPAEQQAEWQQLQDGARAQWEAWEASEESQAAYQQQEDARTAAEDRLNASRERAGTATRRWVEDRGEWRKRPESPDA